MQESLKMQGERPKAEHQEAVWSKAERRLTGIGGFILRYGVVLFLVVFGLTKWTKMEALGIQPMVSHSPLLFWLYRVMDVQHGSEVIGVVELTIAALMVTRSFRPLLSAVGSLLAVPMFLTTLSFLVTTPGLGPSDSGFLMKDLILLGAALWSAGRSLASRQGTIHSEATVSPLTPSGKKHHVTRSRTRRSTRIPANGLAPTSTKFTAPRHFAAGVCATHLPARRRARIL